MSNLEKYTDEVLINRLQEDVESGITLIMEQYAGILWTVCSNRLENCEDVKECVNDVFAEFCLDYKKFDKKKGDLKSYLCRIADRRAIDKYRENLRQIEKEDALARNLSERWEAKETVFDTETLEEALDSLAPIDSQILRMKYYDGLSYKEIASQIHLDYEIVKKRSQRSKKKLLRILLLGLLLAALAACAVLAIKKYRVSEHFGFIWDLDETMYELDKCENYYQKDDVRYYVLDALYQNQELKIKFALEWVGLTDDDRKWEQQFDVYESDFYEQIGKQAKLDDFLMVESEKESFYLLDGLSKIQDEKVSIFFVGLKFEEALDEELTEFDVTIKISEDMVFDLSMKEMETLEYEETNQQTAFIDVGTLRTGPVYQGETHTIASLYYEGFKEYQLTSLLTNDYMGIGNWNRENVVLIDGNGEEVSTQRIMCQDITIEEPQKIFELYFPIVENGDYLLKIPYLCLTRNWTTETQTIQLPTGEDNYLKCDTTILFEDGSGMHITGIERNETFVEFETYDEATNTIHQFKKKRWIYILEYEMQSVADLICTFATMQGQSSERTMISNRIDEENRFAVTIEQEEEPQQMSVQLVNPIYILNRETTFTITIQNSMED